MSQSFFDRRSFAIILVAVFLMPFLLRGTRLALESNRNDVKDWLPSHFEETKIHRWFQEHFPHEQFVLVSWKGSMPDDPGCTLDDLRLEVLAKKLEAQPEAERAAGEPWFFKSVLTGSRLVEELQDRYPELSRPQVLKRLEGSLIGEDHRRTCLVVTLSETAKGKNLRATLEKIRQIAEQQCAIPREDIRMGGPPVDNVAIDIEGERTLYRLAGLSAVVGLGISWLCFRSVRLTILVFMIGILAAGIGLASVYWTGLLTYLIGLKEISSSYGTCDAILLSMPSLVYVLAISGAVHIVNYYHDAIREHGLHRATQRALGHGMVPCALAALTTALGLGSLLASHLIPISKFGLYSAWGVLATLGLLFLFLPACLHYFPSREYVAGGARNRHGGAEDTILTRFWRRVGQVIIGHNLLITAACLLVMGVFMVGLSRIETSVKLMKLFSPEAEIIDHYGWLEEHLGPLVPMEVVIRVDSARCRLNMVQRMRMARDVEHAIEGRLKDLAIEEQLQNVGSALSAATFAPPIGKTSKNARIRLGYSTRDSVTSRHLERFRDSFREYLVVDEEEELWRISARVWALTDLDYSLFVDTLSETVENVLDDNYRRLSPQDLAAGAKPVEGIEVTYTGLVPLVYKAQHELMGGLYSSLKWAFVLIAIVMILVLRSPAAGLLAMIPNIFPVVLIFGAMGWLGILVDVGTMMTASVALGVAVDDTIHFLSWFRRGLDEGRDRQGAVMLAYERCGTAMTQTTLIGGLGLSVFAFSTFTPTQRFGVLMLTLLFAALFGDLIFLPAVLSSPIGRFFRTHKAATVGRGGRKKAKPSDEPPPDGTSQRATDEQPPQESPSARDADDEVIAVPITRPARRDASPRSTRAS